MATRPNIRGANSRSTPDQGEPTPTAAIDDGMDSDFSEERPSYQQMSRDANAVHEEWKQRFRQRQQGPLRKPEGLDEINFEYRFVRYADSGKYDPVNIQNAQAEGYTPVMVSEIPNAPSMEGIEHNIPLPEGVYVVQDQVLCKRPRSIANAHAEVERERSYEQLANATSQFSEAMSDEIKAGLLSTKKPEMTFTKVRGRREMKQRMTSFMND